MDMPRLTVALTFDHDAISDGIRRAGVVFHRLDRYVERWRAMPPA